MLQERMKRRREAVYAESGPVIVGNFLVIECVKESEIEKEPLFSRSKKSNGNGEQCTEDYDGKLEEVRLL